LDKLSRRYRFRYSFICQGSSPKNNEETNAVFESICHLLLPV